VLTTTTIGPDGVQHRDGCDLVISPAEGEVVWIDCVGPDEGDLEQISRVLPLHPLVVDEVSRHGQRAKLERYPDHALVVAHARASDGDLSEVALVIGERWLVTVRECNEHGETFDVAPVRERYDRVRLPELGVGLLTYVVLDEIVSGYFDAVEGSEDRLEDLETTLFDQGPPPDGSLQHDLLDLRKSLVLFRRRVVPLRDVLLAVLRGEVPWVEDASLVWFQNVLDHHLRVIDQIDTQRELMGNVVDASLGLSSNRMNQVMKKMTSWGAILIVATLIAGIYGMNFKDMPELGWRFGYPGALGLMLGCTGGLYLWFRRKGWL
jgi:magnesium transporter